jgi:diaminopimelate decarboxylase
MHHFAYRDGVLHAEAVNLIDLAQSVGTPFYCYSTATLTRHFDAFAGAFSDVKALVCYALKANSNQAVIKTLANRGAGADVVSAAELAFAVDEGILCLNVESEPELALLSSIAVGKGRTARISVRVNPDVDARTHSKIATGKAENKFGIPISRARDVYALAAKLPGLEVTGVDMHIGSQITELAPFENAFALLADFVRTLRADGHGISHIDLGGGLGIPYREDYEPPPDPLAYAEIVKRATRNLECTLVLEPGRLLVGNAGILVTRVIYLKRGESRTFVIVDAGMNDLIRPTLYEAHHDIWPVREQQAGSPMPVDVVGPVCESGDFFALDRKMAPPQAGDLLAIMTAGAYGAVQAGTYNTRPLVPEVIVREGKWALVRPRLEVEELIAHDRMPPWL